MARAGEGCTARLARAPALFQLGCVLGDAGPVRGEFFGFTGFVEGSRALIQVAEPIIEPDVAEISVAPVSSVDASPNALIVATAGAEETHVADWVTS